MNQSSLRDQAVAVTELLPRLARRLFRMDDDDPVMEMPVAQLRMCGILLDGPRTMSSLSKELGISLSAITQIAGRLEKSGLVERLTESHDRRVRCLQLTHLGSQIMATRKQKRVEGVLDVLARLSQQQREDVISSLRDLLSAGEDVKVGNSESELVSLFGCMQPK